MKILKICTTKLGGAGIAALRIMEALNQQKGISCDFLSAKVNREYSENIAITREGRYIEIEIPVNNWDCYGVLNNALIHNNRTNISNTWFSLSLIKADWDDHIFELSKEYDVIHLHWVTQLVSLDLINRLNSFGKKIVITGHDENYFTGGCHYTAGCEMYFTGCFSCPQIISDKINMVGTNFHNKKITYKNSSIRWTFPSHWLSQQFEKSQFYNQESPVTVIRNTLNTQIFKVITSEEKQLIRNKYLIDSNDIIIVSGAVDNKEKRKGFKYAVEAIKGIRKKNIDDNKKLNIKILTFGLGAEMPTGFGITHLPLGVLSESQIVEILQISDLLLFTSIEENFSNLILEALACGCPVLGFSIGGIPEIIKDGVNGALVSCIDYQSYTEAAVNIVFGNIHILRKSTEFWRLNNFELFSNERISNQFIDLYLRDIPRSNIKNVNQSYKFEDLLSINSSTTIADSVIVGEQIQRIDKIPSVAIMKGFSDFENHSDYGRIAWLKLRSSIILNPSTCNEKQDSIAIICPYSEWNIYNIEKAFTNIEAFLGSENLSIELVKDANRAYCIFIISPIMEINSFVEIKVHFKNPTVDLEVDKRQLCLLTIGAVPFNKKNLNNLDTQSQIISYILNIYVESNQDWSANKYLSFEKNKYETIKNKILVATDILIKENFE
jgi:glycosyltransferase involved in cell wall biosynthesis